MYDIAKYEEAGSVQEAIELLLVNPNAMLISGGSDVLIKLHEGKIHDAQLISIHGIAELKGIFLKEDGTIVIGSGASFSQVSKHPIVQQYIPVLGEAVDMVGGPQIRNIGSIGGNICNGVTSADSASTLFAFNAKLEIQGPDGVRYIPIADFYKGPGKVDLRHEEILTTILIAPEDYQGYSGHYIKYAMRNAMDIATLGCVVLCNVEGGKKIKDFRLALGVAAPIPMRCKGTEEQVKGRIFTEALLEEVGKMAIEEVNPRTSWRASKEFRIQLIQELSKRAFRQAFINAGGEL
ncbi:MAG: Xanthine dehydrogenase [Pelosinus sp.]|jgi:xanthine dehydrogenase FAD-binding subunit|nr:Xanthine dehydrogenase [Pelosinus sp.]